MALVDCFGCGKKISSKALQCPSCGNPQRAKRGVLICDECQAQVPDGHAGTCPACGNPDISSVAEQIAEVNPLWQQPAQLEEADKLPIIPVGPVVPAKVGELEQEYTKITAVRGDVPAHDLKTQIEVAFSARRDEERKALIAGLEKARQSLDTRRSLAKFQRVGESFEAGCGAIVLMVLGIWVLDKLDVDSPFVVKAYFFIFAVVVLIGLVVNQLRSFFKVVRYKKSARDKELEIRVLEARIASLNDG